MGSDMAMEKTTVDTYGKWEMDRDHQVFRIYRKVSPHYSNAVAIWSGTPTEVVNNSALITLLIGAIPVRPEPVLTKKTRVYKVLQELGGCLTEYFDETDWDNYTVRILEIFDEDDS